MSKKIINIIIFTVAAIACALGFGLPYFSIMTPELYDEVGVLKSNNAEIVVDLESVTLDKLPTFIEKYQKVLILLMLLLKKLSSKRYSLYL
jgi:hypothetical protein